MAKNDGGPAFPVTLEQLECDATGMTRRQLYAGLAMAADLGNPANARNILYGLSDEGMQEVAKHHWRMADALLATESEEHDERG